MPHIVIKCYKGRSKEELQAVADKVAQSAADAFGMNKGSVSVAIEQVDKETWPDIYHNEIYGDPEKLFVEPQYKM
ncbi:MAG: 4-oxalocrotonate tautomerase family protein [Saccharofermentans sp.]|nr:4-oxalocrotonate tautomerase family protein [Saccharofermentans sp.]